MNVRKIQFNLDCSKVGIQKNITGIRVGDVKSIEFVIRLVDGNKVFPCVTDNETIVATIYGKKPDRKDLIKTCDIIDGNLNYLLDEQDTACEGSVVYQVVISSQDSKGNVKILATPKFQAIVEARNDVTENIESTSEYTALDEALLKAEAINSKKVAELIGYDSVDNYTIAFDDSGRIVWVTSDTTLHSGVFFNMARTATKVVIGKNVTDINYAFSSQTSVQAVYLYPDNYDNLYDNYFSNNTAGLRLPLTIIPIIQIKNFTYLIDLMSAIGLPILQDVLNPIWQTMNNKSDYATTLDGYGITDAYTKTETDTVVEALENKITTPTIYSKNLLKVEHKTVTNNGMTFLSNKDGVFEVKGRANHEAVAEFATDFTLQPDVYYCFSVADKTQINNDDFNAEKPIKFILFSNGNEVISFAVPLSNNNATSKTKFVRGETVHIDAIKMYAPAEKVSGIHFKPQLEQGEEATEYQSPDYFVEGHLLIPLAEKSVKMEHLSDEVKDAFASQGNGSGQGEQGFGIYYHDMPIDVDKGLGIGDEVTLGKFGVLANVRVGDFVIFKPVSFPSVMAKVTDTTLWGNGGVSMMVVAVLEGEKGEKGDTGATGSAGADGYTPIKGVDYFTKDDKAEIAQIVIDEFGSEVMALLGEDE